MYLTSQLRSPSGKRTKAQAIFKDFHSEKRKALITMSRPKNLNMMMTPIMKRVLKRKAKRSILNFM